jgi:hypothetical protein
MAELEYKPFAVSNYKIRDIGNNHQLILISKRGEATRTFQGFLMHT